MDQVRKIELGLCFAVFCAFVGLVAVVAVAGVGCAKFVEMLLP